MSPPVEGGPTIRVLPGSDDMVGGPLFCMYHEITNSPLLLGDWKCQSVYMRVTDRPLTGPYLGPDCAAVLHGVNIMNRQHDVATQVLLHHAWAPGHPMPDWFMVASDTHRVLFHVYIHFDNKYLYAMVTHV